MKFSKLGAAILTVLEEAGEENVAALLNSTRAACHHQSSCLHEFRITLSGLVEKDFIEIANTRHETSKTWIPLQKSEAVVLLQQLDFLLSWSGSRDLWLWNSPAPRIEVLLTTSGAMAARAVLAERGWPSSPN